MISGDNLNSPKRELGTENIGVFTTEKFNEYLQSGNYETYLMTYRGNLAESIAKLDYADAYITERFFAVVYIKNGMLEQFMNDVPEITLIEPNHPYTLSELSVEHTGNYNVIDKGNLPLDGEGVIVGIIGTGIDYLNPRFRTEEGESRIVAMWDQTIKTGPPPAVIVFGTEYNKESINTIIKANQVDKLPKDSLPSRDEEGFGTAIAGFIGGGKLKNDTIFSSIAPKCEFAIVNLQPANESFLKLIGVDENLKNVYQTSRMVAALRYLSYVQYKLKKPMVVYFPLGCNIGERNGWSILEQYIDIIGQRRDFCIVTNTGSEGSGETHVGGTINATGETKEIFINVPESQKTLYLSLYTQDSDKVDTSIISPAGETIVKILMEENFQLHSDVVNGIQFDYLVQRTPGSNISLDIILRNVPAGIWKVILYGEYIFNGLYDMNLFQKELLKPGTGFLEPNPYTTLLIPGSTRNIMVTSYFNNLDNSIAPNSGRGYPRTGSIIPAVTCEGFDLLTVGVNNSLVTCSGAAMAGAILAGAVALIYQWGLVQGNNTNLYPAQLKNLLISSTLREENVLYPNEEWGFGKFSFEKLGEVLKNEGRNNNEHLKSSCNNNGSKEYLYINIPSEIYYRIK